MNYFSKLDKIASVYLKLATEPKGKWKAEIGQAQMDPSPDKYQVEIGTAEIEDPQFAVEIGEAKIEEDPKYELTFGPAKIDKDKA